MSQGLCILGSTGSIGQQTLQLVSAFPERFHVRSLACGNQIDVFRNQIIQFRPKAVSVASQDQAECLRNEFAGLSVYSGDDGMQRCLEVSGVDAVVVGVVGFCGLAPTLSAIKMGLRVALATKEALIVGGSLLQGALKESSAVLIPVDSEHNALFQLLNGRSPAEVDQLVLTASGGPFLVSKELDERSVTVEMAIRHPKWNMGPKISVDSATLMNKGLELIEAHYLFNQPESKIEVWIHPQSIVHGAIRLVDGSVLASMSLPDMRLSIGYALAWPARLEKIVDPLGFDQMHRLEFFPPDEARFIALRLARQAVQAGPSTIIALNAANEVAVEAFLRRQIGFHQIRSVWHEVLGEHQIVGIHALEDVFRTDEISRFSALSAIRRFV